MVASRTRVSAYYPARFWLSAFCASLAPTSIGYQDLAALITHQPGASAGFSQHLIASPFGTIEPATFSYSRPIGSAIPELLGYFQNVNFDPRSLDAYAWKIDEAMTTRPSRQIEYPTVDRANKGDRLPANNSSPAPADAASLPQLQPISAPAAPAAPAVAPQPSHNEQHAEERDTAPPVAQMDAQDEALAWATPAGPPHVDLAGSAADDDIVIADKPPEIPTPGDADANDAPTTLDQMSFLGDGTDRSADIYFGNGSMGSPAGLQSWAPGAEPILVPPTEDSDIKLSALEGTDTGEGESIAGKDDASRLESPAQRLGLTGKPRAEAEKCLADAVYFEARGEVFKGQQAVAQVVMNRVFSGYYPHDVCGVVYQNANRHLACQFTFACEGKDLNKIDEPDMWEQAKQIAKETLDGTIWLAEVGHATHYHAYWVHPSWVHEMAKLYHLGVHTFYRPLNWGDGDDEPVWGSAADKLDARPNPEALSENPEPAPKSPDAPLKSPQAAVAPAADKTATAKL